MRRIPAALALILLCGCSSTEQADLPPPRVAIECPSDALVIAGFGQSKAANSIAGAIDVRTPGLYEFFQGECFRLDNPTLGGTGPGGSIYSVLGPKLLEFQSLPVVFVVGASGGHNARGLDEDVFPKFQKDIEALPYPVNAFIHIQGETDARQGNTNFLPHTRSIFDKMRALSAVPIITFLDTRCGDDQRYRARVRKYQQQIAEERDYVFLAGDLDELGPEYNNPGRCHLNWAGAEIATDQIVAAMITSGVIGLADNL